MIVFAQDTLAMLLKAKVLCVGGRLVRRGVVLFSVFMTRHASVISSMLGSPCLCSVRWRHCSTAVAQDESKSFGLASLPAMGVLPYWSRHLSLRCPSPIKYMSDSKTNWICLNN